MIRYALRCAEGHEFDAWFQSAEAFDALASAGRLDCATCGGTGVTKAMMAPKLPARGERPLSTPADPAEAALADLRKRVEADATYVGGTFAAEARAMHAGEKPGKAIWGEANAKDAMALIADGVPVAPLPFHPRAKVN